MDDALRFIAQGLAMLTNPLPHNQNMNSRTNDPHCALGGYQNPLKANTSQPDLGKEPAPPEIPLRIEKPTDKHEVANYIPKGVLKHSGHNPNAQAAQNYSIVEDLG